MCEMQDSRSPRGRGRTVSLSQREHILAEAHAALQSRSTHCPLDGGRTVVDASGAEALLSTARNRQAVHPTHTNLQGDFVQTTQYTPQQVVLLGLESLAAMRRAHEIANR